MFNQNEFYSWDFMKNKSWAHKINVYIGLALRLQCFLHCLTLYLGFYSIESSMKAFVD